jgi:hypothetical protein
MSFFRPLPSWRGSQYRPWSGLPRRPVPLPSEPDVHAALARELVSVMEMLTAQRERNAVLAAERAEARRHVERLESEVLALRGHSCGQATDAELRVWAARVEQLQVQNEELTRELLNTRGHDISPDSRMPLGTGPFSERSFW